MKDYLKFVLSMCFILLIVCFIVAGIIAVAPDTDWGSYWLAVLALWGTVTLMCLIFPGVVWILEKINEL